MAEFENKIASAQGAQCAAGPSTTALGRAVDSHHQHGQNHTPHSDQKNHFHGPPPQESSFIAVHAHHHSHGHHHFNESHQHHSHGDHSDHNHHAPAKASESASSWSAQSPYADPGDNLGRLAGGDYSTPAPTIGGVPNPVLQPIPISPFWQTSDSAGSDPAQAYSPVAGLQTPGAAIISESASVDLTAVGPGDSPNLFMTPLNIQTPSASGHVAGSEHGLEIAAGIDSSQRRPNLPHIHPPKHNHLADWQPGQYKTFTPPPRNPIYSLHNAPQERRKSWAGNHPTRHRVTPNSHSISFSSPPQGGKRRVLSAAGRLSPLMMEGTPSKLGRGAMAGRIISFMNGVRFRGRDTKRLAILIALNIAYSTTEFLIGLFAGKIELVSDAFHLSFGCCILILSLVAMVWGRKKADVHFTYGYGRLEVLAAFTNALFLLFLSFSLSVEALHAFIEDESEHKHYLIVSAVANLLVNLLGVLFFRHYARVNMQYQRPQDMNHHAIFLHLLSDSIRSAGVILASWFLAIGVRSAETICMGLVAATVLALSLPMLRASGGLLLQMAPAGISEDALHKCIREAASYEGVLECVDIRFWAMVPGAIVGTMTMKVLDGSDEQRILQHAHSVFNDIGITDLTVQIEKG